MAIDPRTLSSTNASDLDDIAPDFPRRLWQRTFIRFPESRARIDLARMVRDEEIVVPIPDRLISDEDTDFVAYIAPERKSLESGMRQSLEENPAVYQKIPLSGEDGDIKRADLAEAFSNALREEIVPWVPMAGKSVEDGEFGITIQYDLSDYQAAPMPSDVLSEAEWKKLSKDEQGEWTQVQRKNKTIRYSRYKLRYWRDAEGRDKNDRYYRDRQDDGTRRAFERNVLATRRAWKEHAKSWKIGYVPLNVEVCSAFDCLPLMTKGTKDQRWNCRGIVKRKRYDVDDVVARGLKWDGLGGDLYPLSFDSKHGNHMIWLYEAWVYLEGVDENGDPELAPCVIYCVDGLRTEQYCDRTGEYEPAVVNLKAEYGMTTLPANYFYGAHTEADDPDKYGFPAMYPLLSPILNQEGAITAYQVHMRKYGMANRMGTTPNKDVPGGPYMSADGSAFEPDMDADIVLLPNPTFPLVMPPAPNAVKDMLGMYRDAIGANSPFSAPQDNSDASGHAMTVQAGLDRAGNSHILDGLKRASEWIGSTAIEMLDMLQEKHPSVKVSVFPRQEVPGNAGGKRKRSNALEFNSRDWNGNYSLRAYYPKVGNLAEVQQTADLYEKNMASFDDLMEARGKQNPFNERVKIAVDQFWKSPEGMKMMMLEALKRRGDMERAELLTKQAKAEMQPQGLPTEGLAPEAQMVAQLGQPGQMPGGAPGMPGMQVPNQAASALGGIVSGAMGTASLQNEANAMAGMPVVGMGVGG